MTIADNNSILTALSRLQTNYTNLALSWFDVFYNSTPKDVTLDLYDANGNITTYTIPNRAKDFRCIKNGSGSPEGAVVGNVGYTYQDTTNGSLFIKSTGSGNTGWQLVAIDSSTKGSGSPEGVVVAGSGDMYLDITNGIPYIKTTTTSNIGWVTITGPTGPQGPQGVVGGIGPQGVVGGIGPTGPQGPDFYGSSTKTSSYTLQGTDRGNTIIVSSPSATTITIPDGLPIGFSCLIVQSGIGQVSFAKSSGGVVTINNRRGYTKISGQYAAASILITSTNVAVLGGDCGL